MTAIPDSMEFDPQVLSQLVERCQTLCERATSKITSLPSERESFLTRNLEDALQQLELILRVLDEEDRDSPEAPPGFLRRLTRGLAKRASGPDEEVAEEATPELSFSQQGLQGSSWTISLPELIMFLASGHKTGVLWVDSPEENFLIGLVEGNLTHATSDRTPEGFRLGEMLVGYGFLTRRQLERFLSVHQEEAGLSGENLLQSGMINDEELRTVLVHQVQQLFHRLIQTKNAIFRFREGMQVMLAYPVSLNITQLLLESARVHDEATREEPSHAPESPAAEAQESDGSESGEQKSASETENPEQADADEAPAESEHDEEAQNGKKEASGKGRKGK